MEIGLKCDGSQGWVHFGMVQIFARLKQRHDSKRDAAVENRSDYCTKNAGEVTKDPKRDTIGSRTFTLHSFQMSFDLVGLQNRAFDIVRC